MNKLHRQLVVLCIQHEEEWDRALKEGKIVFGVGERDGKYLVIINWYTDLWEREQIVVCAVDDENRALKIKNNVKKFVYSKFNLESYLNKG